MPLVQGCCWSQLGAEATGPAGPGAASPSPFPGAQTPLPCLPALLLGAAEMTRFGGQWVRYLLLAKLGAPITALEMEGVCGENSVIKSPS